MKRKLLAALVITGGLFLTSCQDENYNEMENIIESTEMSSPVGGNNGQGGSGGGQSGGSGSGTGGDGNG